jgi:hypothetical protein
LRGFRGGASVVRISNLLFSLAVPLAGLAIFASLPGEGSAAMRQFIVAQLAPVAALVDTSRNASFYSHGSDGSPSSAFDAFAGKGKVDVNFTACIESSGSDFSATLQKFLSMSDHRTVANVASCFIAANRPGLCEAAGKAKIAAMMEVYLWARQYSLRPGMLAMKSVGHLKNESDDPAETTWDGPDDHAVFAALKRLAIDGYISLDDFGLLPRAEIRQAFEGVVAERRPCVKQAAGTP